MKKVALINAFHGYNPTNIASAAIPPIGMCYLAGILDKEGYEITVIDALGEALYQTWSHGVFQLRGLTFDQIMERIPGDIELIGVSNLFANTFPVMGPMSRLLKERFPGVPLVLGGVTPTSLPEFCLDNFSFDFIVLGEGELTFIDLLKALETGAGPDGIDGLAYRSDGENHVNPRVRLIQDLDILPFPRYDLIPMENYIKAKEWHGAARGRSAPLLATRGCPYQCSFCTAPGMWKPYWRTRSQKNVVDEMEWMIKKFAINDFHFEDLTVGKDHDWMQGLCNEILGRNLKITWQIPNGTRAEALDEPLIKLMRRSGCTNMVLAPESASPEVLDLMHKDLDLKVIERAAMLSKKHGIVTCAFFLLGFPGETLEQAKKTIKYSAHLAWLGVDECAYSTFTPLPGSEVFYKFLNEGKLKLDDAFFLGQCNDDLMHAVSWSESITDRQLTRMRFFGYVKFFLVSYLRHPSKAFKTLYNVLFGIQETKSQRILRQKLVERFKVSRKASAK